MVDDVIDFDPRSGEPSDNYYDGGIRAWTENGKLWYKVKGESPQSLDAVANTVTVTGDYAASDGEVVLADASGAALTVTLPEPEDGQFVVVKKTDGSTNAVTVATPNTETIDGSSTASISTQYARERVTSDGNNFFLA